MLQFWDVYRQNYKALSLVLNNVHMNHNIVGYINAKSLFLFQYGHQKDYTFKSSLFCVVGVWVLVFGSEVFQIGVHSEWYRIDVSLYRNG